MFIATDDLLINTGQITSAHYTPEHPALDLDDYRADENGMFPATLTVYFPVAAGEAESGNPYVELTGEAADKIWELLRFGITRFAMPSRKKIDYEARSRMRAERQQAKACAAGVEYDMPF